MADGIPEKDNLLLAFSVNFKNLIVASPTAFGLTSALAASYQTTQGQFATALQTAQDPLTRTRVSIEIKQALKKDLISATRALARMVQAAPGVTDAQKLSLGLKVKNPPTPVPVPTVAPDVDVVSVIGRTVKIRTHDATDENKRGKPKGVASVAVYSYVGPTAPTTQAAYKFEGISTRTDITILFPETVASGATVWVSAAWLNPRGQAGPASTPTSITIQGGPALAVAA